MQIKILLLLFLSFTISKAQTNGYWDKERATNKQISVSARERMLIPIEDLPEGTTEIVYRITLLDENQQLSSSFFAINPPRKLTHLCENNSSFCLRR